MFGTNERVNSVVILCKFPSNIMLLVLNKGHAVEPNKQKLIIFNANKTLACGR